MRKTTTFKKVIGAIALCCSLVLSNPAKAFIWPCIDIAQISSFVNSIKTGISTITNAKAQLENVMATIKSIGDQIATMKKYMADLRDTITKLKEDIEGAIAAVKDGINEIKSAINEIEGKIDGLLNKEKETAKATVDNVNQGAVSGYSSTDLQDIIAAARLASEANRDATNQLYDEALDQINETLDNASQSVDALVNATNTNKDLSDEDKAKLNAAADDIKNDINGIKESANKAINEAKENLNTQYANEISSAYDEYSKAIDDYALGKITIEELNQAGETFKDTINSLDGGVTQGLIDEISAQVDGVVEKIENLKEEILDTVSNSKDYSDEDEDDNVTQEENKELGAPTINKGRLPLLKDGLTPLKTIDAKDKFTFNYKSEKYNVLAVAVYNEDVEGSPFLVSKEFMCNSKYGVEDLSNPSWFRICVSIAKMNQELYPNEVTNELYDPYRLSGLYNHILQDYSTANIVTISRAKQFASSFRGDVGDEASSEMKSLEKMISKGDVDNTLNGVAALSTIELWTPRIWSMIRQVDAVNKAKNVVKTFVPEVKLFLDPREDGAEDVKKATNDNRGKIGEQKVFPNVVLYHCHDNKVESGIKAEDISIEKGKELSDQEEKLKNCLYMYASGASRGYLDGQNPENATDETKKIWREKQKMALNDAAFENLTLSTIANYNSTRDYISVSSLGNGEVNIVSLQDGIKQVSQARDGYAAGAQINYYGTQQLLNIVESDALDLQTEILKDLQTFDYSYFPEGE